MFGASLFGASRHARGGSARALGEHVATLGPPAIVRGCARLRSSAVPFAVAASVTAAYRFTASTSFADRAATPARAATDTFAGVRPADVPGFIVAPLIGAASAAALFRRSIPRVPEVAPTVAVPHEQR
jgi:glycerol uptake facilitator-like aquaporin